MPYATCHFELSAFLTYETRLDSLYYESARDRLPENRFSPSFASELLSMLEQFARELRPEIS